MSADQDIHIDQDALPALVAVRSIALVRRLLRWLVILAWRNSLFFESENGKSTIENTRYFRRLLRWASRWPQGAESYRQEQRRILLPAKTAIISPSNPSLTLIVSLLCKRQPTAESHTKNTEEPECVYWSNLVKAIVELQQQNRLPRESLQMFVVVMDAPCATSPNVPAQARRGNDVRFLTETRSRRCMQSAGSTFSLMTFLGLPSPGSNVQARLRESNHNDGSHPNLMPHR